MNEANGKGRSKNKRIDRERQREVKFEQLKGEVRERTGSSKREESE